MTFGELQQGVFDDLQYQAQPKPGVQDRIRRYLNEGLERVLRRPRLKMLRHGKMPLMSVAGQGFYGAPPILERIDYVIDTTNGRRLAFRTRDWYRALDPALMATGTPSYWIPEGIGPVRRQPRVDPADNLTKVWVRSEGAPGGIDTTQVIRMLSSYAGPGVEVQQQATLNGENFVLITNPGGVGLAGPSEITKLSLGSTAQSSVYVTDHTDPFAFWENPIAFIQAGTLSTRYLGFRLFPTPATAIPYEIEGQRVIPRMLYHEDEPPFPADFHELLQCYARGRMYRKDGRLAQAREEFAEYERYCLDLTVAMEYPINYKPVAGKLFDHTGTSQLGPWYPADRGLLSD